VCCICFLSWLVSGPCESGWFSWNYLRPSATTPASSRGIKVAVIRIFLGFGQGAFLAGGRAFTGHGLILCLSARHIGLVLDYSLALQGGIVSHEEIIVLGLLVASATPSQLIAKALLQTMLVQGGQVNVRQARHIQVL